MKLNTKTTIKNSIINFSKYFLLISAFIVFCSHDLYLKMGTYFLQENQEATLSLYNGTFETSENIITRDRIIDASVVSQGERKAINTNDWQDKDSTITQLKFKTGNSGTYVAAVSTKARNIELTADKFNAYLKSDGVYDMLDYRTKNNLLNQNAVENYQKHVKAIYQVGKVKTDDWKTVLGYPIEFVPQANPYKKYSGDSIDVLLLLDGKPVANQLVFADNIKSANAHSHDNENDKHTHDGEMHSHDNPENNEEHTHTNGQQLRTNDKGIVTVNLQEEGIYYMRTISMVNVTDSDELTHKSKWATLTFEIGHSHNNNEHAHDDHHDNEIPTWVFILGSIFAVGVLFLIFRNKDK
ncbi:DUF4198 domain-containing protein [Polaribacter vadi]|uniref:DUF4198 domain-containing protein n=1 Tax=Polaribacter vadi TaxID=1774273 RepID=UPI001C098C70|nr:DUF4198 domain-containing protein [Polaribacter vadi]MBU3012657.1 DUF4198 domain-containing protein [Polaribacter vadi]